VTLTEQVKNVLRRRCIDAARRMAEACRVPVPGGRIDVRVTETSDGAEVTATYTGVAQRTSLRERMGL
jgi:hypothetical protein